MLSKVVRVLLIEDDEEDFMITRDVIDDIPGRKYKLDWVSSFEDGKKAIEEHSHDIYLVDYRLGKETGLKLLDLSKKMWASIPIILLTGNDNYDLDLEAMELGAADFLIKGQITPGALDRSMRYSLKLNATLNQLQQNRSRLKEAQQIAAVGNFEWDLVSHEITWSDQHYRIFDIEPQSKKMDYSSFLKFVPSNDVPRLNDAMKSLKNGRSEIEIEYTIQTSDKITKKIFGKAKSYKDYKGKVIKVSGITQDITKLKEQEVLIAKEQQKAKTYLEMAGSLIVVVDRNEEVSLINKEGSRILGFEEQDVLGKNWFDHFIPETDRKEVREVFSKVMSGKQEELEYYENKLISKEKGIRLIRWYNRVIKNEAGEVLGTISSGVDITEQEKAKVALVESRLKLENYATDLELAVKTKTKELGISAAKLKQASSLAKIGYWEINLKEEKPKTNFSKEYCELYEVNEFEPGNDRRYFLQFIEDKERNRVVKLTKKAIKAGSGHFFFQATTTSGRAIFLQSEVKAIYSEDQKLETIFSVVQDVTEQKKAELQLENALKKEKELGQLKSRFVSMASHEFRTPLTSILSSVSLIDMLNEKGKLEGQKKYVKRIESSVDNLTTILNDFLSLEKLESGNVSEIKDDVNILEFVDELKDDVSAMLKEDQIVQHHHQGKETIVLDPHLLKNIMLNLLSNAIKYAPSNTIVAINSQLEEQQLKIEVIDQGIGIPMEDQKHMFTRFFRANNAANIKGTGLGLTIVKRYLDLMDGSISFESVENVGTTFTVIIPQ